MAIKQEKWKTIKRPGYFGKHRDELHRQYNKTYGKNNWRIAWMVNGKIFSKEEAILLYEDSYYIFLKKHPQIFGRKARQYKNPSQWRLEFLHHILQFLKNQFKGVGHRIQAKA